MDMFFNGKAESLDGCALKMNVLNWVRTRKGQRGTKEGCGTGDCGACTVVVGEQQAGSFYYFSANACLLPMQSLEGKHLITVEYLQQEQEPLHPVQQAMIDCHGSQCGFCTPGIVMSLLALYLNHESWPGKGKVIESLSGNLCRCTGYQPIIAAAEKAFQAPKVVLPLPAISAASSEPAPEGSENPGDLSPKNLKAFFNTLTTFPDADLYAGGTDHFVGVNQAGTGASERIYLGHIEELAVIEDLQDELLIGAAVPYQSFLPLLLDYFPSAREMFERLGSVQIRNLGTLGGSLGNASPVGDPLPFLLVQDARLTLISTRGSRILPVKDFFQGFRQTALAEKEIIAGIHIPKPQKADKLFFYKVSQRHEDDISTVCAAIRWRINEGRIEQVAVAFGGMAAIPKRAVSVEAKLLGAAFTQETIYQAAQALVDDFTPLSDARASGHYRQQVAENLLLRAFYDHNRLPVRIHHA